VTIASAPLSGRDGERYTTDLGLRKTRIFFKRGWTDLFNGSPSGKSPGASDGYFRFTPDSRPSSTGLACRKNAKRRPHRLLA
jgi:hypothetical protein